MIYVSQPAVSLQVQNLERLDVPLSTGGGRRAQLRWDIPAQLQGKILTLCQETCRAIEDRKSPRRDPNCCFSNGRNVSLPDWLFRQKYPDVVQLRVPPRARLLRCGKWTVRPSNYWG